jgi:hypothetical protein
MNESLLRKLSETLARIEAERDRLAQQAEYFRADNLVLLTPAPA